MKYLSLSILLSILLQLNLWSNNEEDRIKTIQIALLLDVSGSMSGLIEQSKAQLWTLANVLSSAQHEGNGVSFEIALISYGIDYDERVPSYRILSHFTNDMDILSEQLFDLTTSGSFEPCPKVIDIAINQLDWSSSSGDLKMIYIAGNERFNQGQLPIIEVCKAAKKRRIIVNTIFCGSSLQGRFLNWSAAASECNGSYHSIEQDSLIRHSESFWDYRIIRYNDLLNSTFLAYGIKGNQKMQLLMKQDANALEQGSVYLRDRVIFKLSNAYSNPSWDLVDKFQQDSSILSSIDADELPLELKGLSQSQQKFVIQRKADERKLYIEGAQIFISKAKEEIKEKESIAGDPTPTLEKSLIGTLKREAQSLGIAFE